MAFSRACQKSAFAVIAFLLLGVTESNAITWAVGDCLVVRTFMPGGTFYDTQWVLSSMDTCGPTWTSERGHFVRAVCGTTDDPTTYMVVLGGAGDLRPVYIRFDVQTPNPSWGWGMPQPIFYMAYGAPAFTAMYGNVSDTMIAYDRYPKNCIADDQEEPPEPPNVDTDNDGIPDSSDSDDDNDGVPDECDMGPKNYSDRRSDCNADGQEDPPEEGSEVLPCSEYGDADGDGIFNKFDDDDDNDGCPDNFDPSPCNPNYKCDCDGDGIQDHLDPDDDNDGCPDEEDEDDCNASVRCESGEKSCPGRQKFDEAMGHVGDKVEEYFAAAFGSGEYGQEFRSYVIHVPIPGGMTQHVYFNSNMEVNGVDISQENLGGLRQVARMVLAVIMWIRLGVACIKAFEVI